MRSERLTVEIIHKRRALVADAVEILEADGNKASAPAIAKITGLTIGQIDKVRYGTLDRRELELIAPESALRAHECREPQSFRTCARCHGPITKYEGWYIEDFLPVHWRHCQPVRRRTRAASCRKARA